MLNTIAEWAVAGSLVYFFAGVFLGGKIAERRWKRRAQTG